MAYTALYRKFRPTTFEDVKGQDHIVTTLKNQINAERIGHAYLFCGTRGTGKTTIAKLFARAVNCEHPVDGSPCGECASCKAIASGASMNVQEIDAASNTGVDNIREIIDDTTFSPAQGRYKVYIIDEVHMLSVGAFNALLKTLEEPPSYVIFILATTEVHKIPITILSRCQRYDFKRISIETITDRLRELMQIEQVDVEEKALHYLGKAADGSMRDALSLLDQCIAFHYGQQLTYDMVLDVLGAVDTGVFSEMLRSILDQNVLGCITVLEDMVMQGRDLVQFVSDFIWYLRNLLLLKVSDHAEEIIDLSAENLKRCQEEAGMAQEETIMRYIRVLSELSGKLRQTTQKRVMIEMTLIKLCKPEMEINQDSVLDRLRVLEKKMENGVTIQTAAVQQGVQAVPKAPVKRAPLPAALPQDIEKVVANWGAIVNNIGQPVKTVLKDTRLSIDQDNKLIIAFEDMGQYDIANQEDHQLEIKNMISDMVQKEVPFRLKLVAEGHSVDEEYPDISQLVQMDIEEEDL